MESKLPTSATAESCEESREINIEQLSLQESHGKARQEAASGQARVELVNWEAEFIRLSLEGVTVLYRPWQRASIFDRLPLPPISFIKQPNKNISGNAAPRVDQPLRSANPVQSLVGTPLPALGAARNEDMTRRQMAEVAARNRHRQNHKRAGTPSPLPVWSLEEEQNKLKRRDQGGPKDDDGSDDGAFAT